MFLHILATGLFVLGVSGDSKDGIAVLPLHSEGKVEARFNPTGPSCALQLLSLLPPGVRLSLAQGSKARILCDNNRLVNLQGPRDWTANEQECVGESLPTSLFERLMDSASPISVTASGEATLKTRAPKGQSSLWVLSPRGSTPDDRPPLAWTVPASAQYFHWTLSEAGSSMGTKVVKAAGLCRRLTASRSLCKMDYPAFGAPLRPGQLVDFTVTRLGADLKPAEAEAQSSFMLTTPQASAELKRELALLAQAPLEPQGACLARSRLLETHGILGEAIVTLLECSGATNTPVFDLPLARLYLASGLAAAALPHLESLAGDSPDPCQRADIDLGFGRAYFLLGEHRRADQLLRSSVAALETCGKDAAHGHVWIKENEQYFRNQ